MIKKFAVVIVALLSISSTSADERLRDKDWLMLTCEEIDSRFSFSRDIYLKKDRTELRSGIHKFTCNQLDGTFVLSCVSTTASFSYKIDRFSGKMRMFLGGKETDLLQCRAVLKPIF